MPRSIWSGAVSFGLVNAPVKMYAAIDEHDLELHFVHEKDGSRIGYQKVCKAEDRPVPAEEIVKAFETDDGTLVYLTDEDFEAAQVEGYKAIEILDFVPYDQIDPIYFERTFYLGPAEGAEKVYMLLVEAMERSGLAAIARYVFHDRQQLGCLRVREGTITLEKMYFADEIRPLDEIRPTRRGSVDGKELDLALTLIDRLSGDFEPSKYDDEYTQRLLQIVREKKKGKEVRRPKPAEPELASDLFAALRESLEQHRGGKSAGRGGRNGGGRRSRSSKGELETMSVDELQRRARELDIRGRSQMSKRELVEAIRDAD